jgi:hypothetical protein
MSFDPTVPWTRVQEAMTKVRTCVIARASDTVSDTATVSESVSTSARVSASSRRAKRRKLAAAQRKANEFSTAAVSE